MSESYGGGLGDASAARTTDQSGAVETAKNEAGELAGTAKQEAGHVVATAKDEAAAVAGEAKTQVKDLYAQTQSELKEQAGAQQQRVAEGLRSVGDELKSMASNTETPGVASDLVQQVSDRVSSAAAWIGDRDPGSLLNEVKSYARRKPGTFIAVAALAGLAVGRLTRALAESAADQKEAAPATGTAVTPAPAPITTVPVTGTSTAVPPVPPIPTDVTAADPALGTPLYDQSRAAWDDTVSGGGVTGGGDGDVRRDSI